MQPLFQCSLQYTRKLPETPVGLVAVMVNKENIVHNPFMRDGVYSRLLYWSKLSFQYWAGGNPKQMQEFHWLQEYYLVSLTLFLLGWRWNSSYGDITTLRAYEWNIFTRIVGEFSAKDWQQLVSTEWSHLAGG